MNAKETSVEASEPVPPVVPVIPRTWTISTIVTYAGAVALFLFGVLAQSGVVVPAHVSTEVQAWVGAASEIAAVATGLISHITNSSVAKAAMRLGAGVHQ